MKKFSEYFTLRNIILYVVVSLLLGILIVLPESILISSRQGIPVETFSAVIAVIMAFSFIGVFIFLALVYWLKKKLLCSYGKNRKIIRLVYAVIISIVIAAVVSFVILSLLDITMKLIFFILITMFGTVIMNLMFKNMQDKEDKNRY